MSKQDEFHMRYTDRSMECIVNCYEAECRRSCSLSERVLHYRTDAATLSRILDKEGPRHAQVSICTSPRSRMARHKMCLLGVVLAIVVRLKLLLHE
jgi:hypothetical protein